MHQIDAVVDIYKKVGGKLVEIPKPEPGCWINISSPFNHKNLELLSRDLDIPLDFLIDSLDVDERSRFEIEDDIKLIVLNIPISSNTDGTRVNQALFTTIPVGIILLPDLMITICSFENPVLDSFINERVKNFDPANRQKFVTQIFDRTVYFFLHYLKQINNKLNVYEEELFASSRNEELIRMLNIQKSLVYFLTSLRQNELLMLKMQRLDILQIKQNEELSDFLEDIIVDASQALEMANIYANILSSTMDAFASVISNNLNMVMKRLTSVTIVLMIPTLIASYYGMNVELPFQNDPHAFVFTVLIALGLCIALVYFLVKKRWF